MLLPEGYRTALEWSLGGTVCKMGSVGRERSWKACSLGSLGYTTPCTQQSSRVCSAKEED